MRSLLDADAPADPAARLELVTEKIAWQVIEHEPELRRLVLAIRATLGIEPLVWLTDVAGLSRDEAADLMRSSARTLLRGALAEAEAEAEAEAAGAVDR